MIIYERIADSISDFVAKPKFFGSLLMLVILWGVAGPFLLFSGIWHLWINTPTTIITTLLVALLHNTQARFEKATNTRLQAIQDSLNVDDPVDDEGQK